jgi:hypothetical protein
VKQFRTSKKNNYHNVQNRAKGGMKSLWYSLETHLKSTYGIKVSESLYSKHGNLEEILLYAVVGAILDQYFPPFTIKCKGQKKVSKKILIM